VAKQLNDAALAYVEGLEDKLARAEGRLAQRDKEILELESEVRDLRRSAPNEILAAGIASALTNLPEAGAMAGVAVSNQQAAVRALNEALRKYHARGPLD
jgi:hypothetical protein